MQRIPIGVIHRPHSRSARGGAFNSSPSTMRERSAGTAQITIGHLTKAPACRVTGTRASRRSTAAILGPITVSSFTGPEACTSRYPGSIGAALHPMLSKPLKAGPSSGPDGDRASWDEVANPACRRRLPAPPTERLRKTPSVSGDGEEYSPKNDVRQVYNCESFFATTGRHPSAGSLFRVNAIWILGANWPQRSLSRWRSPTRAIRLGINALGHVLITTRCLLCPQ